MRTDRPVSLRLPLSILTRLETQSRQTLLFRHRVLFAAVLLGLEVMERDELWTSRLGSTLGVLKNGGE